VSINYYQQTKTHSQQINKLINYYQQIITTAKPKGPKSGRASLKTRKGRASSKPREGLVQGNKRATHH
jgi:hypothetical protein